jgi:hypothetical protein
MHIATAVLGRPILASPALSAAAMLAVLSSLDNKMNAHKVDLGIAFEESRRMDIVAAGANRADALEAMLSGLGATALSKAVEDDMHKFVCDRLPKVLTPFERRIVENYPDSFLARQFIDKAAHKLEAQYMSNIGRNTMRVAARLFGPASGISMGMLHLGLMRAFSPAARFMTNMLAMTFGARAMMSEIGLHFGHHGHHHHGLARLSMAAAGLALGGLFMGNSRAAHALGHMLDKKPEVAVALALTMTAATFAGALGAMLGLDSPRDIMAVTSKTLHSLKVLEKANNNPVYALFHKNEVREAREHMKNLLCPPLAEFAGETRALLASLVSAQIRNNLL